MRVARFFVCVLVCLTAIACKKPVVTTMGQPLAQGSAEVVLNSATYVRIDLEDAAGAVIVSEPVLQLDLSVTNTGAGPLSYDLGWAATAATQAQSVLLFADPGGTPPEPQQADNIPGIDTILTRYPADPVTAVTTIEPGATLNDLLLFSAPSADVTSLLLSIPPRVFGSEVELPGYIRFDAPSAADVAALPVGTMGTPVAGDGYALNVQRISTVYERITNTSGEEGITGQPVVKLELAISNTGGEALTYRPPNTSRDLRTPSLVGADMVPLNFATFPAGITVAGRITAASPIAAGATINEVLYFDRPAQGSAGNLTFLFHGKRVGRTGLTRVNVPYTWSDPPLPEEWRPPVQPTQDAPDAQE